MDYRWIGWLGSVFIAMTLICNIMTGTLLNESDVAILQQQKITQDVTVGFISIPIPGLNYITGIMRLMDFKEYNEVIFTGNAQIIYYFLSGVVFVIGFTLFITVIGLGVNAIRAR